MNSTDDNKSDKPPVIRTTESAANGGQPKSGPQVTGNANEEHITSGPSFFEKLFGTSISGKPVEKNDGKTVVSPSNDRTMVKPGGDNSVVASSSTPPPLPADGAAKEGDGKPGDTTTGASGDSKPEEKKSYVFREPEGPLKPHYARARAELLFDPPTPTVYMTPDAYKRMCLYVELAPKEVGWLGTISKRPNGDFLIEQVFLVEQQVTPVETELSVEGSEKLVLELLEGGDPGLEKANKLHFWGHSHVRMGTSPSGTDESTMLRFSREGHEFYERGIFNKLGRGTFDVYYYTEGYRLLDVPWAVMDPETGKVILDKNKGSWWRGGQSNDRPTGYNYGGSYSPNGGYQSTWRERQEEQAKQQDEQSGLSSFLKREEETSPAPKKVDPLAIDDALRAEVTAEYRAKVKERIFAPFRWFGKKDDEDQNGSDGKGKGEGENKSEAGSGEPKQLTPGSGPDDVASQVVDGELIPTGSDIRSGNTVSGTSVPRVSGSAIKGATEEKKGFWAWLGSIFESSPSSYQPPIQTQERPKKRCTPQNCNDASHPWSTNYKGAKTNIAPNNRADRLPDDAQ